MLLVLSMGVGLQLVSAILIRNMYWICSSVFILLTLSRWTSADCYSYGVDYVDGGGPYCINTTSTDFFSFVSDFQGMSLAVYTGSCTNHDKAVNPAIVKVISHQS